jgi:hypothetical protein
VTDLNAWLDSEVLFERVVCVKYSNTYRMIND